MLNFKNFIVKNDRYEFELILELKNCEILEVDTEYVFIKPDSYEKLAELKKEIVKIHKKSDQLYCDCKKIKNVDGLHFEEVIKVKRNDIEVQENGQYNLNILVYGIWFSTKRSSYGPMIKLLNAVPVNKELTGFLPDPDDYDSDEEINESIQYYAKLHSSKRKIKKKKVIL